MPADRRGRRAGRARRPPRPVRAAADAAEPGRRLDELLGATVHQAATDDRAERDALVERVVAELRARVAARTSSASAGRASSGRSARCWPASNSPTQAARGGSARRRRAPVRDRRHPGRPPRRLRTAGQTTAVMASPSTPPEPSCDRRSRPSSPGSAGLDGLAAVGDADRASMAASSAPATAGRPPPPTRRPGSWPAPRGSWSTRSTPPRRSPAWSRWPETARFDGQRVVFWHAGGTPGLFEPLDAWTRT